MKKSSIRFCLLLFGVCLMLFGQIHAQVPVLKNIRAVTNAGEYSTPVWSPDNQKLLFTGHHNDQLFVLDLANGQKVEQVKTGQGIGYMAKWSDDGQSILFRESADGMTMQNLQVKSLSLATKQEKVLSGVNPDLQRSYGKAAIGSANKATSVSINPETLLLEAQTGQYGKPWVVTKEPGQYYHPIISPDGQSVVVHEGANMYVYRLKGNNGRINLGMGLASGWMPDGSGIVTFEDQSHDGHHVSQSELYWIDVVSTKKSQLTRSEGVFEMWPNISPDGKQIAFSDEKSGKIFIADLTF